MMLLRIDDMVDEIIDTLNYEKLVKSSAHPDDVASFLYIQKRNIHNILVSFRYVNGYNSCECRD